MDGEYLIRFVQGHETFRRPELEALAQYEETELSILDYQETSPFCIVKFGQRSNGLSKSNHLPSSNTDASKKSSETTAASFISRSILSKSILELWGTGVDYESLHADVKSRTKHLWSSYRTCSFKFSFDSFCGKRSQAEQRKIVNSFSYLGFEGEISMKNPDEEFVVMEEWNYDPGPSSLRSREQTENEYGDPVRVPRRLFLGRMVGPSKRGVIEKHDLKKRPYISTTSMDAELALITATLALAAPNKLFLDPFVGTGGFMIAASELGALSIGSDIDGRSFRGKGTGTDKGVGLNYQKYSLQHLYGDCITSDLTNTPFRIHPIHQRTPAVTRTSDRWLDGIIADPPYGVREGLRVLGVRNSKVRRAVALQASTSTKEDKDTTVTTPSSSSSAEQPAAPTTSTQPAPEPASDQSINTSTPPSTTQPTQSTQPYLVNGIPAYTLPGYIPPKKPYGFNAMLNDILDFAARTLVDKGRLAFWMPTANAESQTETDQNASFNENMNTGPSVRKDDPSRLPGETGEPTREHGASMSIPIPMHPCLELKHVCTQSFNKWSRRLLVYERRVGIPLDQSTGAASQVQTAGEGMLNADDLNPFRRMYFRGFQV